MQCNHEAAAQTPPSIETSVLALSTAHLSLPLSYFPNNKLTAKLDNKRSNPWHWSRLTLSFLYTVLTSVQDCGDRFTQAGHRSTGSRSKVSCPAYMPRGWHISSVRSALWSETILIHLDILDIPWVADTCLPMLSMRFARASKLRQFRMLWTPKVTSLFFLQN